MDRLNSDYKDSGEHDSQAKATGFLNFFKALQNSTVPPQPALAQVEPSLNDASVVGLSPFYEPVPVYKGSYPKLSPLAFNTLPVDDASNSKLDPAKLAQYTRSQLFFLLRLERFLRLRKYWLDAAPRSDEAWKTSLALRGVYTAVRDCREHGVGSVAIQLLKDWECC